MGFELSALESRVLGCLLEKERLTPENYPLSLNALTNACNQSTNREPVASYDEKSVEAGVNSLRERKLASVIFGAGSRVQKYKHRLLEHYELQPREVALLCVLLLRGAQTPGELRTRTERMFNFGSLEAVEACLDQLARDSAPLVRQLDARPGQKERRYVQLLSAAAVSDEAPGEEPVVPSTSSSMPKPEPVSRVDRVETLEKEVTALRTELTALREELATFRRQFE